MNFNKIYEVCFPGSTSPIGYIKKGSEGGWCFHQTSQVSLNEIEMLKITKELNELNKNDPKGERP